MQTQYAKTKRAYMRALSTIEELSKNKDLPDDLIVDIFELRSKFNDYDITTHKEKGRTLTGTVLTEQEAVKAVIDATGYNRWSIENLDEEGETHEHRIKHLKENYGVEFDESEFKRYSISRETRSRDDFWLVQIYAFAGHCWFSMDTGRADMCLDKIISNDELTESIEANFN
jgi:hypothetical protein